MPQPFVESPNLRAEIALIVDDPAPCINPLWYFRNQVDGQSRPAHQRTIPLDFMEQWSRWVSATGIRGDFTILPYPAGLGRVDRGLEGCDSGEVRAWLALAREFVAPQFDIHCEILTHTRALDLRDGSLRAQSEHEWMADQDEETLAEYFSLAMEILGAAGVSSHGLTQPCYFHGDEAMYARAILAAEQRVNRRSVTHNFLHVDWVAPQVPPRLTHLDPEAGEAVVSIWAGTDDYIWNTQNRGNPAQKMTPEQLADRFLTADGAGGRLAELLRGGGPLVLVTHWQSLYSNGSRLGLRTYEELVARISALWGEQVAWRKLSEITDHFLAAQTVRFATEATPETVTVTATAPFTTDILTISIPMPWPLEKAPTVQLDGQRIPDIGKAAQLRAGTWLMRGSILTVSLPLAASVPSKITIQRAPR